jgi:hypothetical protein
MGSNPKSLRSCLAKHHTHFASVILIIAIRIIFSEVPVNISKSFAKRRKLFNQEKVHSTTQRFGKTAQVSLIFSEI